MTQSFQLDAAKNAEFNRFLFGFTAAAGEDAADALDVTIADFALSYIRPGNIFFFILIIFIFIIFIFIFIIFILIIFLLLSPLKIQARKSPRGYPRAFLVVVKKTYRFKAFFSAAICAAAQYFGPLVGNAV